jgi:O-acetyl-ADP-ribose deacetylase (regulator of RNase III)
MIQYVVGDATDPQGPGKKIIVHVCNNIGAWGKGFVMALSAKWSKPEENFRWWASHGIAGNYYLGQIQYVQVEDDIWVANMVAQNGVRSEDNPKPIDYNALTNCLANIALSADVEGASIHMPRIGCGLAGGDWDIVESIINNLMPDIPVTVYDLEQ